MASDDLMTRQERSLYHLQKTLIHRHFPGLMPREVRLVDGLDFDGRALEPRLELARRLGERGCGDSGALMLHLLVHYEMKDHGRALWRGHGPYFTRRAAKLGILSTTLESRCCSFDDWLNEPALRAGKHAVNMRPIDLIFGLSRAYKDALHDFFINERWLRGGGSVPESLLPWVKFYSEEITDVISVGAWVTALTSA